MVDTHVSVRQFWRRRQPQRRQPEFKICAGAHAAGIGTSIATANRAGSVTLHPGRPDGRENYGTRGSHRRGEPHRHRDQGAGVGALARARDRDRQQQERKMATECGGRPVIRRGPKRVT